jgi:hypothetical protein
MNNQPEGPEGIFGIQQSASNKIFQANIIKYLALRNDSRKRKKSNN